MSFYQRGLQDCSSRAMVGFEAKKAPPSQVATLAIVGGIGAFIFLVLPKLAKSRLPSAHTVSKRPPPWDDINRALKAKGSRATIEGA